jgi:thermostable 8-oxoguanine DNA glycosylase
MFKNYGRGWNFSDSDFLIGLGVHDYERKLLGVTAPLTVESLFPTFAYSILSVAQNTTTLVKIFSMLRRRGFLNPENITVGNYEAIKDILKHTHFPTQKIFRYSNLGIWYKNNRELLNRIVDNSNNGGSSTMELRNELAEANLPGVKYKVASFIMQLSIENPGAVPVVVIDKWVMQFLCDIGLSVKAPDYRTVSGFHFKDYLKFEKVLSEMAINLGLSPSQFGLMVWCKKAYYEPNHYILDYISSEHSQV